MFIIFLILLLCLFFGYANAEIYTNKKLNDLIPRIKEKIDNNPTLFCGIYAKSNWLKEEININGDFPFPAASLIKLPVAVILLQEIESGEKSLADIIELQDKHFAEGSGILYENKENKNISVKKLFELMLTISDNTAFNALVDYLGGIAAVNRKLNALGLSNTILIDYISDFSGWNKTSPHDLIISLDKSFDGSLFGEKNQKYLKETLFKCSNTSLIKRGLKPKTKFAHKTGTIGIALGDAGIIYLPWGKTLSIAIIVKRPFNDYNAKTLIRDLTRLVVNDLT